VIVAGRHLAGWKPSRPDHRDLLYSVTPVILPASADVSAGCSRVEDQGQIGSCTANASTDAMEFLEIRAGAQVTQLSRLFVYWTTRVLIERGSPADDSGAHIRDVMKSLRKYGACPEASWPYDPGYMSAKPTPVAFAEAKLRMVTSYAAVPGLDGVRHSLAVDGLPVVGGFSVPESMMSAECASTGIVVFPASGERIVGGHAILFVGYDDSTRLVKFKNSWSEKWGKGGYGFLPYVFFERRLADDLWQVRAEKLPVPVRGPGPSDQAN
jgi:C1A family cysteine protease